MQKTISVFALIVSLVAVSFSVAKLLTNNSSPSFGSVNLANEYQSTTTSASVGLNVAPAVFTQATGAGSLGSVIIETTGAGVLTIFDATTSDSTKRTVQATSSLKILAAFTTSPTVGVYTFDNTYFNGLLISTVGAQGTTTITNRNSQ